MNKYVFIGNRYFVLERMFKNNCNIIKIFAVPNSFLSMQLDLMKIEYETVESKEKLINELIGQDYDVLVSNGCPYILPISQLDNGKRKFINIHPSFLPDLKGKNPINGALLFNRKHGVTCHYMDDGIDTGRIIERLEIPVSKEINLDLLYQISFRAEGVVFDLALKNGFSCKELPYMEKTMYFTRTDIDLLISLDDDLDTILRKVRAFSSPGQYARFVHNDVVVLIKSAIIIDNPIAYLVFDVNESNKVICKYGDNYILTNLERRLVQFEILSSNSSFEIGEKLIN